uniref:Uncharacterized protein n=1 Tax=Anguilla anguilla TaxID=7936 RepID=A0A0E9SWI8_ANGAN
MTYFVRFSSFFFLLSPSVVKVFTSHSGFFEMSTRAHTKK